ncbi:hypothetical protein [Streptomyces albipurpureus]|uniref:Uncharacterized protein n=1 Tax=Streptomyces albipurpureus TaxID=2897419 RepID=A0ABT0UTG7_9ACTN|nr:hypothetical protein [Streptomyces sp. CWNU-1]MCM2391739.1 hypothetical protein [Streptomyces sp. CWNU-1]
MSEVDEYSRDERTNAYYQGWGARDMAERIVQLEDELGDDVDGIFTGMHADVAEAHAEIERLTRALRLSEAKEGGAALYVDQANSRSDMLENAMVAYEGIADERDRYRLAWLSARRRAKQHRSWWRGARHRMKTYRAMLRHEHRVASEIEQLRKSTHGNRNKRGLPPHN